MNELKYMRQHYLKSHVMLRKFEIIDPWKADSNRFRYNSVQYVDEH